MKHIYGKLTVKAKEFDESDKVIKVSSFSIANVTIDEADDIAAEYEAMIHKLCGFNNYSINRTFTF